MGHNLSAIPDRIRIGVHNVFDWKRMPDITGLTETEQAVLDALYEACSENPELPEIYTSVWACLKHLARGDVSAACWNLKYPDWDKMNSIHRGLGQALMAWKPQAI